VRWVAIDGSRVFLNGGERAALDVPGCRAPICDFPAARAWARARAGDLVEVGCQAGLGRTGTAIACMEILSGVEPIQAVD